MKRETMILQHAFNGLTCFFTADNGQTYKMN